MEVSAVDVLTRAKDLLGEYGWTKGAFARTSDGDRVLADDQEAITFCSLGAMRRASLELGAPALSYYQGLHKLSLYARTQRNFITLRKCSTIADWNDACVSARQIKVGFDDAIVAASEYVRVREEMWV